MKKFSKRFYGIIAAAVVIVAIAGVLLYVSAQTLTAQIIQGQLRRQGYSSADISNVRLYMDGIVIGHVQLNDRLSLDGIFTPQSAPDIARNGLKYIIIRHWNQTITDNTHLPTIWPFPKAESLSVEQMDLHIQLPLKTVTLSGTLKSLQPEPGNLVLVLPFEAAETAYSLQGKLEMMIEKGQLTSIDINLDDGSYQSPELSLKRMSGWFNAQFEAHHLSELQAQFIAGSAQYNNQPFADAMVQYSYDQKSAAQWTINLNRAAENYFNSWVIKPTIDGRYAIQIASQRGEDSKSAVMISAGPLRLEPLLPAQAQ